MDLHELEELFEAVGRPFDQAITDKGAELEATLRDNCRTLLDEIEELHWNRSRALTIKAFAVGKDIGRALAPHLTSSPRAEDS